MERSELERYLLEREEVLRVLALKGPHGQLDGRKAKKLGEVVGFCEVILRYVREFLAAKDALRVVEFSCGKSYLGIVLVLLLRELDGRRVSLVGSDMNAVLVEHCRQVADALGLDDAEFVACRTREFGIDGEVDVAVALHACDTATDEAIAKGIEIGARLILTVPCCQNQIRGQIKTGHGLTGMTDFGPIRYRLANMLTDVLRAQFLKSAGYHVEMAEIGSPRLTPKNLCICARRSKRAGRAPRDADYRALKEFFGVSPAIEKLCPDVIQTDD